MTSLTTVSSSTTSAVGIMLFCSGPYLHHLSQCLGQLLSEWRREYSQGPGKHFFTLQNVCVYYWIWKTQPCMKFSWQLLRRYLTILTDFILKAESGCNISKPSECVSLDLTRETIFICPLTSLGDWGLGKSSHISLWSPPFQIEQSRFLFSRPILHRQVSPFICIGISRLL